MHVRPDSKVMQVMQLFVNVLSIFSRDVHFSVCLALKFRVDKQKYVSIIDVAKRTI